jgi:hypothetical protein
MKQDRRIPARAVMASPDVERFLMREQIASVNDRVEHIGVMCMDKIGKLTRGETLEVISGESSARSVKSIDEIGNACGKDGQVWWHTHPTTLSSLSAEDRISAGNLKSWLGNNLMCAAGIEGFSCHALDSRVPRVMTKRWGKDYFDELEKSPVITPVLDMDSTWHVKKTNESSASHLLCASKNGVVKCTGIDWDSGITHFPVGAFTSVIFTGNVDVTPSDGGFELLASPVDSKLECIAMNAGKTSKPLTRIMYCR